MRRIDCLVCGEDSHTILDNEGRHGLKITNVSCNGICDGDPGWDPDDMGNGIWDSSADNGVALFLQILSLMKTRIRRFMNYYIGHSFMGLTNP